MDIQNHIQTLKNTAMRPIEISKDELDSFPCSVENIKIPVENQPDVSVFVTTPLNKTENCPIIINYHGGGFVRGRSDRDELFCRRAAHTFKCTVFDVDYSLAPDYPFPTAVEQARACAEYIKNNAEKFGCNGEKIVLCGQSAGGNLVANVCMEEIENPAVKPLCAVIAYSPLDLYTDPDLKPKPQRDMSTERAKAYNALYCDENTAKDYRVSPVFADDKHLSALPDTLVITAGEDRLADEGELFASKLIKAGVKVTAKRFNGCVHGFFINRMDDWQDGIKLVHDFISQYI